MPELQIIALIAGFAIKHFLADFVLQTASMVQEKGYYGRRGGLIHAGWHAALSVPVLLIAAPSVWVALALGLIEGVVHYHLDYAKERLSRNLGDTHRDHRFWVVLGLDQLLHHLTYAAMIALLLKL
jgi:hypothetical protein